MLQLSQAFPGAPNSEETVTYLSLGERLLIVYASQGNIVLLETPSLALFRVIPFFEAYPGLTNLLTKIEAIAADSEDAIIAASVGNQIGFWVPSGSGGWKVHSTLGISHRVRGIHYRAARLLLYSDEHMSVWEPRDEEGIIVWTRVWEISVNTAPFLAQLSETGAVIASAHQDHMTVRISDTRKKRVQHLRHPRALARLSWRRPTTGNRSSLTLFTVTVDGTLRIWQPVLDSPHTLRLWASVDPYSFRSPDPLLQVRWLEKPTRPTEESSFQASDIFFGISSDGQVGVRSVSNIEKRPPTLLAAHNAHRFPDNVTLRTGEPTTILPLPSAASPAVMFLSPVSMIALSVGLSLNVDEEHTIQIKGERGNSNRFGLQHSAAINEVHRSSTGTSFITQSNREIIFWDARLDPPRSVVRWHTQSDRVAVIDCGVLVSCDEGIKVLHLSDPTYSIPIPTNLSAIRTFVHASASHVLALTTTECIEIDIQARQVVARTALPHSESHLRVPIDGEQGEILSIGLNGDLAFWTYVKTGFHVTGGLKTGRKNISMAVCSAQRQSALVNSDDEGHHLSIWNSKLSEFASGLEYEHSFSDEIMSIRWTWSGSQLLAVCFSSYVVLMWPERMTYFDTTPSWSSTFRINIIEFTPLALSKAIFLATGSLVITAGNMVFAFSPSLRSDASSVHDNLYQLVASRIGPLPDWHPQMLLQCLLWDRVDRVKQVLERLTALLTNEDASREPVRDRLLKFDEELYVDDGLSDLKDNSRRSAHTSIFDSISDLSFESDGSFSRSIVAKLLAALDKNPLPDLTPNELENLKALAETTLEIDEQRRSLDANGLRYLISLRSFFILNRGMENPAVPTGLLVERTRSKPSGARSRLRYRDMLWAYHSESQDLLLQAAQDACGGKITWSDARALGLFVWLQSPETMKTQLENVARNEYMAGDNRDPTACCLYYFALGKRRLVHGLWKQAAWHHEQAVMVKFLANDFDQPRWRTAALKNAYALLGKKRYEYAAAFFLLAGSLQDAVNVCVKQIGDVQLAIAIARVVEQGDQGPVLRDLLMKVVIPLAFKEDNRWLGSWAFWMVHQRDLAVRIILTPLADLAGILDISVDSIGEPRYDDPSLAILFTQLKAKTLQAAKGTSEISEQSEFNFVLQMARVFCRMGCHVLALELVKSWSFDRPSVIVARRRDSTSAVDTSEEVELPPTRPQRPGRLFSLAGRRQSTLRIDVDIPSLPVTRAPSPKLSAVSEAAPSIEDAAQARQTGLGSLMKSAKRDTTVPEFDMNAFF